MPTLTSAHFFCRFENDNWPHDTQQDNQQDKGDKGCAVRFVDYIARFSTYIVNRSTINGEISQDNPQISSPQT